MNTKKIIKYISLGIFMVILFGMSIQAWAEDPVETAERENKYCLKCHKADGLEAVYKGKTYSLNIKQDDYHSSIHGTMACTKCHTDIKGYPHEHEKYGKELAKEIDDKCKACHQDINKIYQNSVHANIQKDDQENEPLMCRDCHGSHYIYKKSDPKSALFSQNIPDTCSTNCHQKEIYQSFADSFHGKAVLMGSQTSANCVSCHGGHNILSQDNPMSMISKENLPGTCAKCHIIPWGNFANGKTHFIPVATAKEQSTVYIYYVKTIFIWILVTLVSFITLHLELELYRRLRNLQKGNPAHPSSANEH